MEQAQVMIQGDFVPFDETLRNKIQGVYQEYFKPDVPTRENMVYEHVVNYGFVNLERKEFSGKNECTADEYIEVLATHGDHTKKAKSRCKYEEREIQKN